MANPHKGEVELKVEDETYVLRFSIDAICALEEAVGKGFPRITLELANPMSVSVSLMRHVLHAALAECHPKVTLKQAGDLIVPAGGIAAVMKRVDAAIKAAFPEAEGGGDTASPPEGPTSDRTGSAS